MSGSGGLRETLAESKTFWWVPAEPVVDKVLVPALKSARQFECMVGYFGAGALKELAHGLAAYITRATAPLRLLISPVLSDDDREALRVGATEPELIAAEALKVALEDEDVLASALARHTRECLAYLVAENRLQMRIVLMPEGIFHCKQWTFIDGDDVAVLSGSANFTQRGVAGNVEKLSLHSTWRGHYEECADALEKFKGYWTNEYTDHAVSVSLSRAIEEKLLKPYAPEAQPQTDDYERARRLEGLPAVNPDPSSGVPFYIPAGLVWDRGDYRHQGEAVDAWEAADRVGALAMATGAGKTITSLIAAQRLWKSIGPLFVVVAAPTRPLVEQWTSEMRDFGLKPYNTLRGASRDHMAQFDKMLSYLKYEASTIESAVVSNDFISRPEVKELLAKHHDRVLLIGDEMHNLGTERFIGDPPRVRYRLGLSATPERQYDEEGTKALFAYFGSVVYEFGLDRAIGLCLVPYRYHVHPVRLGDEEHEQYVELSAKIRAAYARSGGNDTPSPSAQRLLEKRRLVLEAASGKLDELERLLVEQDPRTLKHTLIYCTDKNSEQLDAVNSLLRRLRIRFHQVTSHETAQAALVRQTVAAFRSGTIQVLTAMRVLDEGFNLPEISTAYVLASTTVRRQWVQRRGRVLRLCGTLYKPYATIHDLVVLPAAGEAGDVDSKRLVKAELERCAEFVALAANRLERDGPSQVIQDLETEYVVWAENAS